MNDAFWNRLLHDISAGNVIPVIGWQFVTASGRAFNRTVADRLLQTYGVERTDRQACAGREINEAVCLIKASPSAPASDSDLRADVAAIISTTSKEFAGDLPPALCKLAAISDFQLFVYLCADNLLAQALKKQVAVQEIEHAPDLPPGDKSDLAPDWKTRSGEASLLYLFGKARSDFFAIHDEDLLEFAHNLISGGQGVPSRFLDEMRSRKLLLIGCSFPDWLSRFFLRVLNRDRLIAKKKHEWYVEETEAGSEFTVFIHNFSRDTEVIRDLSPGAFVDELHRRWLEQRTPEAAQESETEAPDSRVGKIFFISYSRKTDAPAANALYTKLLELGVERSEVWFDRETLEPADTFQTKILSGIDRCRYFLPVISHAADNRSEAFFRREWRRAAYRQEGMAASTDFVLPLVVDESYLPESYNTLPENWTKTDFGHAPAGEPDARTTEKLRKWLRAARSRQE